MKHMIAVVAVLALAACSKPAEAPDAATETTAEATAAPAAETLAADGKASYGTFKVTHKDGKVHTAVVKPDGTYSVADAGEKVVETGKWEQKSQEQYCETADKAGAKQKCYTEKVDDKGVYTSKDPETGDVATVTRVEG